RNASLFFMTDFVSTDIKHYKYAIAYSDSTHRTVKCAFYRGKGAWETQIASQTEGGSAYLSGAYHGFTDDAVTIAYYDVKHADLKVVHRDGAWFGGTLASNGDVGLYNRIIERDGHLSFFSYDR